MSMLCLFCFFCFFLKSNILETADHMCLTYLHIVFVSSTSKLNQRKNVSYKYNNVHTNDHTNII